jgi:hypothetical protein
VVANTEKFDLHVLMFDAFGQALTSVDNSLNFTTRGNGDLTLNLPKLEVSAGAGAGGAGAGAGTAAGAAGAGAGGAGGAGNAGTVLLVLVLLPQHLWAALGPMHAAQQ